MWSCFVTLTACGLLSVAACIVVEGFDECFSMGFDLPVLAKGDGVHFLGLVATRA